jgi:glucose-6-phosphate 1-epimerase
VTLAAHKLSTDLHVTNTSLSDTLAFQALLHNYLRVPADEVVISPLQNLTYYDKTETTEEARAAPKIETRAQVDCKRVTDSVYEDAPLNYDISWPTGKIQLKVANFKDLVVWNPQQEGQKIGDMEENGW